MQKWLFRGVLSFLIICLVGCGSDLESLDDMEEKQDALASESKEESSRESREENPVTFRDDFDDNNNFAPDIDDDMDDDPVDSMCANGQGVYLPNGKNQIIIEAEDHKAVGHFKVRSNVKDFAGKGFMVYQNSDIPSGGSHKFDGKSELKFKYLIEEDGTYTFALRAARYEGDMNYRVENSHDNDACPRGKAKDCTQADLNNDAFLGTTGRSPAKIFVGFGKTTDEWKFGGTFDINHKKSAPKVQLKKGLHTLTIQGRSNLFAIDRLYIYKNDRPGQKDPASKNDCE